MSLKKEIEKLIRAEQKKLRLEDQRNEEFNEQQSVLFKPLESSLNEIANSVKKEFLEVEIRENTARVKVGRRKGAYFEPNTDWTIEPNYGHHTSPKEDGTLFYEKPGFMVEEIIWSIGDVDTKAQKMTFKTEQEVVDYLIKAIAKHVAFQGRLKKKKRRLRPQEK